MTEERNDELVEGIARRLWEVQGDSARRFEDVGAHWRGIFLNMAREIAPLVEAAEAMLRKAEDQRLFYPSVDYVGGTGERLRAALKPWVEPTK